MTVWAASPVFLGVVAGSWGVTDWAGFRALLEGVVNGSWGFVTGPTEIGGHISFRAAVNIVFSWLATTEQKVASNCALSCDGTIGGTLAPSGGVVD